MALVIAVLFLLLASVLSATFMIQTTGERSISSNTQVAKGALYAADAGVRAMEQKFANLAKVKLDSLTAMYAGSGMVIPSPRILFPSGTFSLSVSSPGFSSTGPIVYVDTIFTDSS